MSYLRASWLARRDEAAARSRLCAFWWPPSAWELVKRREQYAQGKVRSEEVAGEEAEAEAEAVAEAVVMVEVVERFVGADRTDEELWREGLRNSKKPLMAVLPFGSAIRERERGKSVM